MKELNHFFHTTWETLLIAALAFFTPIKYLVLGVGSLIVLDTIVGVYKAYKINELITSKKFSNIISKMLLYQLAIVSAFIVQQMIGLDEIPLAKIVAVAIGLTELKSITESVEEGTGLNIWKFVRLAMNRTTDKATVIVDEAFDEKKEV